MIATDWRTRAGTIFQCEKRPASGTRGMVVTNHPLASAAGTEMLAAGGNAIDAAIAALFALTVVEPMMVGVLGGGIMHIRLTGGRHVVIDNQSMAPLATDATTYTPDPAAAPGTMGALERRNAVGATAVATPGNLKGWCDALLRLGTLPLADVMVPAIRLATRGFRVTPYLHECVSDVAADMVSDPEIANLYLPGGRPIVAGTRLVLADYAETLRGIAREGPDLLYAGALGALFADHMMKSGGYLTREDLKRLMDVSAELAELHRRKAEAVEGIGQLLEEHDKESGENITAGDLLRHYHRTGNATKLRALKRWWRQHDQAEAELHELDRK